MDIPRPSEEAIAALKDKEKRDDELMDTFYGGRKTPVVVSARADNGVEQAKGDVSARADKLEDRSVGAADVSARADKVEDRAMGAPVVSARADNGADRRKSGVSAVPANSPRAAESVPGTDRERLRALALDVIEPDPDQPRRTFDEATLEELAASIRVNGQIQPIVVRPAGAKFILICGERRWRASKLLGRATIDAVVRDVDATTAFKMAITENVERDSLLPIEEARAYERLLTLRGVSQSELARELEVDRRRVSDKLALLRLPTAVQDLLSARADTIGERHALLLATAPERTDVVALAERCAKESWSLPRLREALLRTQRDEAEPTLFQNLQVSVNRRGGFTLHVRARSRDEVAHTIAELERTIDTLRTSFGLTGAVLRSNVPEGEVSAHADSDGEEPMPAT